MTSKAKPIIIAAIVSGCLFGHPSEATAAGQEIHQTAPRDHSTNQKACPSPDTVENALGKASDLMEQARYQVAAKTLEPLSSLECDARISLLLARALESEGNFPEAEQTLQRAHLKWLSNDSIATSLARHISTLGRPIRLYKL